MKVKTLFMSQVPIFSIWIVTLVFYVAMMFSTWMTDRKHEEELSALTAKHATAMESSRHEAYSAGFDACFTAMGATGGEDKKIIFQLPSRIITVPDGYVLTFEKQGWAVLEREKDGTKENSEKGE